MLLSFAHRYIFSKKSTNAINIISWVSISALAVGTAALLTVLSVFNGIEDFIKTLYTNFYSDVKISSVAEQPFIPSQNTISYLQALPQVKQLGLAYEENVLLTADNAQQIVTLRGVDESLARMCKLNDCVRYGDTNIFLPEPRVHIGLSIANRLSISEQRMVPISLYAFKRDAHIAQAPQDAYTEGQFYIAGVFNVQEEFDNKYCITSLAQAQNLLQQPGAITSIEINAASDKAAQQLIESTAEQLKKLGLKAETKFQQNKTLYYVLKSEKWMVFAILSFVLLITSFNMIGSLSMLVLEKKEDINTLRAMGSKAGMVRNIFLSTGMYIGLLGAGIGIALALLLCALQHRFGLVSMSGDSFLLAAYPVKVMLTDVLAVLAVVLAVSLLASWFPSAKARALAAKGV